MSKAIDATSCARCKVEVRGVSGFCDDHRLPRSRHAQGGAVMTPTHPVTVGGWYQNTDGTVTRYHWRAGQLCTGETVASWAQVPCSDCVITEDEDRYCERHR